MVACTAIGTLYYRLHSLYLAIIATEDKPERIGHFENAW
jgi:hypothetical protein